MMLPRVEGAGSEQDRDGAAAAGDQLTFENDDVGRSEPQVQLGESGGHSGGHDGAWLYSNNLNVYS